MQKTFFSITLPFFLILSACAQQGPTKDFQMGERVQVITLSKSSHVYAQNDVVLNDTLEQKLSAKNPEWEKSLNSYSNYETWAVAAGIAQFVTLLGCVVDSSDDAIGWCVGSIGLGLGVSIPLSKKASEIKFGVIRDYNQSLSPK